MKKIFLAAILLVAAASQSIHAETVVSISDDSVSASCFAGTGIWLSISAMISKTASSAFSCTGVSTPCWATANG